tara:strand:- start:5598 stop:5753 length:156 start_codon:yes stop_codon:yes gene_type:complete
MKNYWLLPVILIFSAWLACQDGSNKRIAPKAKKTTSFKPLIQKDISEKKLS